ncbi:MAG: hypothetical protein QNK31_09565, partial [Porticoccus sp.]|nr:hypothetical protein [Porticoccus sp.]
MLRVIRIPQHDCLQLSLMFKKLRFDLCFLLVQKKVDGIQRGRCERISHERDLHLVCAAVASFVSVYGC